THCPLPARYCSLTLYLSLPRPPTSTLFPYTTLFRSQPTKDRTVVLVSVLFVFELGHGDGLAQEPTQVQKVGQVLAVLLTSGPDLATVGGVELGVVPHQSPHGLGAAPASRAVNVGITHG